MKPPERSQEKAIGITRLFTQQVRLRHVEQVSVRGLPPCSECPTPKLCFSVHERVGDGSSSPYTSTAQPINNPIWNLDKDAIPASLGRLKGFVMRISCIHGLEKKHVILSWVVHLSGLVPVIGDAEAQAPAILFRIQGDVYTAKDCCRQDHLIPFHRAITTQVNGSLVRPSCSVSSVTRLRMIQRAIQQNSITKKRLFTDLSSKVESSGERKAMNKKLEDKHLRLNVLKEYIRRKKKSLEKMECLVSLQKQATSQSGEDLSALKKNLETMKEGDKKYYGSVVALHEQLSACVAELGHRRKELITQLSMIYPITCDSDHTYRICGVHLPNAEEYDNIDDTQLSVGMGYVCHLVSMVAHFLDVPLRYPIVFQASRSQIKDHISSKLADNERAFSFNERSKAKYKLWVDYAVFLQNKNIGQLRWYCGLATSDLRATLANLHSLIQLRLGLNRLTTPPRPLRLGECSSPQGSDWDQEQLLPKSISVDHGLQGISVSPGEMVRQASEPNLSGEPSSRGENLLLEVNNKTDMRQWDRDSLRLQLKNGSSPEVPVVVEPDMRDFEFVDYSPTGSLDSCLEMREEPNGTPKAVPMEKHLELITESEGKDEKNDVQDTNAGDESSQNGETNGIQGNITPDVEEQIQSAELNDEESIWKDVEGLDLEDFNEFACRAEALSSKSTTFNFRLGASRSTSVERDPGKGS